MSDDEWSSFLKAIPTDKLSPFGNYTEYLLKEGVTDEDIKWWNGLGSVEQQKIKEESLTSRLKVVNIYTTYEGISPSEALIKYFKEGVHFADYPFASQVITELKNLGYTSEDDYPLPWELSERIGNHSSSIIRDPERFKQLQDMVRSTTSGNAAIRLWIRKGVL